jgi:hypothetical protein
MLNAAMGGLTPHEALIKASLDEAASGQRAAAKEKTGSGPCDYWRRSRKPKANRRASFF